MKRQVISLLFALGASALVYRSNHKLQVEYFKVKNELIKKPFRIVHLSDTHIPYSSFKLNRLVDEVKKLHPDLILLTGDILDRQAQNQDISRMKWFIDQLNQNCDLILCVGNHDDKFINEYQNIKYFSVISNSYLVKQVKGNQISFYQGHPKNFKAEEGMMNIVLDHYPNHAPLFLPKENTYQFSGHVHGGQFRINNKGVFGPHQGFWPEYSKGYYPFSKTSGLFVSAGLGATQIPLRINNPNHLIVVDFSGLRYNKKEGEFHE